VITLGDLASLADRDPAALAHPVAPVTIAGVRHDLDAEPMVMGVVNLSRDSTYRDSVSVSTQAAVRRGRVLAAQGAGLVDVGAESSTARAARVDDRSQIAALVPVIEQLSADGIATSVEAYSPAVVGACLRAGAAVLNLTGTRDLPEIYALAAEHAAAVILCFVPRGDVREVGEVVLDRDPIPVLADYFTARIDQARACGVTQLLVDPGLGFYYANLTDPVVRARHQARVLLGSFRLRSLGVPICQAMPHAFDLFEGEFRTAEGFFAVLSVLGRVNLVRTHEVAHVRAVLAAMAALSVDGC